MRMTWSQKARAEGFSEGQAKGIQAGMLQGRLAGGRAMITRILAARFGPLTDVAHARLAAIDDPVVFEHLADRALAADTLDEALDVDGLPAAGA